MKFLLTIIFILSLHQSFGQDTTFYRTYDTETYMREGASMFEINSVSNGEVRRYFLNGSIAMSGHRIEEVIQGEVIKYHENAGVFEKSIYKNGVPEGICRRWYPGGQLMGVFYYTSAEMQVGLDYHEEIIDYYFEDGRQSVKEGIGFAQTFYFDGTLSAEGDVLNGRKHGSWIGYNKKGQVIYRENYEGNKLIKGESYFKGMVNHYNQIDVSSAYSGGDAEFDQIFESIPHPQGDRPKRKTGTMFVFFVIEEDGSYSNIRFYYSLGPKFEDEVKRALYNSEKWIPGSHRGIKLRQKMVQTITFE